MEQADKEWLVLWLLPESGEGVPFDAFSRQLGQPWRVVRLGDTRPVDSPAPDFVIANPESLSSAPAAAAWSEQRDAPRILIARPKASASLDPLPAADCVLSDEQWRTANPRDLLLQALFKRCAKLAGEVRLQPVLVRWIAQGRMASGITHALANTLQSVVGHIQLAREEPQAAGEDLATALDAARQARELLRLHATFAAGMATEQAGVSAAQAAQLGQVLRSVLRRGHSLVLHGESACARILRPLSEITLVLTELVALAQELLPRGAQHELHWQDAGRRLALEFRAVGQGAMQSLPQTRPAAWSERLSAFESLVAALGLTPGFQQWAANTWTYRIEFEAQSSEDALPGPRALVLEPRSAEALQLTHRLEQLGLSCTLVHNTVDALEFLQRRQYELLIADESQSELPGELLAREAARLDPRVVVVLLSAFQNYTTAAQGSYLNYLPRQISDQELAYNLRRYLVQRNT